jgi:hypothetical protein
MPKPKDGESEKDFVSRCIPIVMDEGTAKDNKQAAAICYSKYEENKKKEIISCAVEKGFRESIKFFKGGPGSGNFGHAGRPGQIGGSASGEGVAVPGEGNYPKKDENGIAYTNKFAGIPAHKKEPSKKHRAAMWEAMLGTVRARNKKGATKTFDYDWEGAAKFSGADIGKDNRVYRYSKNRHGNISTSRDWEGPSNGKLVLWVKD